MKPEIEAKFSNVNHEVLRNKLRALGATCEQPMRLMKRKNYDFPDGRLEKTKGAWVRLRDEGDKVTMSYKQIDAKTVDGMSEICLTVSDFETGDAFLAAIGLATKNYQETRRETWTLANCEIVLDEWPWLKPSMEIEGPDEQSLKVIAMKLALDWGQAMFGSVEIIYRAEYAVTADEAHHTPIITFETQPPASWKRKKA